MKKRRGYQRLWVMLGAMMISSLLDNAARNYSRETTLTARVPQACAVTGCGTVCTSDNECLNDRCPDCVKKGDRHVCSKIVDERTAGSIRFTTPSRSQH